MDDVAVVGGGIVGLLAGRALAERGRRVRVLDSGAARPSASWAGGGILMPLFPWRHPAAITALCQNALTRYQTLAASLACEQPDPEAQVQRTGMLVYAHDERDTARAWGHAHGQPVESIHDQALEPALAGNPALWLPEVGVVRNPRFLKALRQHLDRQDGVQRNQAIVQRLRPASGGWELELADGACRARQVLVAAGTWSAELLAPRGLHLPLMPVQGEMLRYPAPRSGPRSILLSHQGYLIPRADGSLLAGSTVVEGETEMRPSRAAGEQLQRMAEELWPPLQGLAPLAQWTGLRPGIRREAPVIGPAPEQAGLYLAAGHYRNGLAAAPATAELITALMCDETPPLDPRPYAVTPG